MGLFDNLFGEKSNNSKITLTELVEVCPMTISNKETFANKYKFSKVMSIPTEAMGEMHAYKNESIDFYFTKYVVIYSSNQAKSQDYMQQATSLGFAKILDRQIVDGHIITFKKGDIHIDFKEPNSSLNLAVYQTKADYQGDLNGMDYNSFESSDKQQPISLSKQTLQNSHAPVNLEFDSDKYGPAIVDAFNGMKEESMSNPVKMFQTIHALENISKLHEKNEMPGVGSLIEVIGLLKIHNQYKLNLFIHIDPLIAIDLLVLVTEHIYSNGGGKDELKATFKEIGVHEEEIEPLGVICLGYYLGIVK